MTSSLRKSVESKFRRDNLPPNDVPYVYKHTSLFDNRIPTIEHELIEWCDVNCQGPWAWWFDANHAYIGFASQEEQLLFKLSCL